MKKLILRLPLPTDSDHTGSISLASFLVLRSALLFSIPPIRFVEVHEKESKLIVALSYTAFISRFALLVFRNVRELVYELFIAEIDDDVLLNRKFASNH